MAPPALVTYDRRNSQVPDSVNAEGYGMHTNVSIAAAITANARLIKGRLKDIVAYRISSNRIPFDLKYVNAEMANLKSSRFFIAPGLSYIEEEGKDPTIRIEGMVNG